MKYFAKEGLRFLMVDMVTKQNFSTNEILKRKYYDLAIIVDEICLPFLTEFVLDKTYFYETYHWLILTTPSNEDNTINFLKNASLNINCDVNMALFDNESDNWTIFDIYNPASNHEGQFTMKKLGHYNFKDGFRAKMTNNKYWVRKNMTGVRFKSAVVIPDPRINLQEYLTSEENRQSNSMHRFQSVAIRYCKEMFNFSLQIQRTNSWGYMTPNGHFDGLTTQNCRGFLSNIFKAFIEDCLVIIVSYLLMDPPRKINNLKDLTDSNLRAGIEDILIDRNYFVQTTDPVAIELFDKKINGNSGNSGFYKPSEGLELLRKGGFAFHVETSTAYPIIERTFTNQEICELEEVQMYRTQPMHTNLQKHSPMLHLVEDGIMYRLRKYWDARRPMCLENAKKVSFHVGLAEFSSGLIILSYGVCMSFLILMFEIIVSRREFIREILYQKNIV
ncbi:Lig chan domain containing protein, partial [Asbolus verrucosus]